MPLGLFFFVVPFTIPLQPDHPGKSFTANPQLINDGILKAKLSISLQVLPCPLPPLPNINLIKLFLLKILKRAMFSEVVKNSRLIFFPLNCHPPWRQGVRYFSPPPLLLLLKAELETVLRVDRSGE